MERKIQPGGFFKLKISLQNLPYPCTRKLLVPWDINMEQFHALIQLAMGWEMSHLFQFVDKKGRDQSIALVQDVMEEFDFMNVTEQRASEHLLKDEFVEKRNSQPFWYWYDFGDDWWHKITFLKPTKSDLKNFTGTPICIEGEGTCPPEDVGGPHGFADFLEVMLGANTEDKRELKEWLGMSSRDQFDVDGIDLEEINGIIEEFFNSEEWEKGFGLEGF